MKKRILSFLLVLVMLVGMLPVNVFATDTGNDVSIYFSVIDAETGDFIVSRRSMTVSPGTGAAYGDSWINDATGETMMETSYDHSVSAEECTPIDALIRAHQLMYGDNFTADTIYDYLAGSSDYVTGFFQRLAPSGGIGFKINGQAPTDGDGCGYAANEYVLQNGDEVVWLAYSSWEYYNDYFAYFTNTEGTEVHSLTVEAGGSVSLVLKGMSGMWGVTEAENIGYVDILLAERKADGFGAELTETVLETTDENGGFTHTFDAAGEYYLSAKGPYTDMNGTSYNLIMPWCKITVTAPQCQHTNITTAYTPAQEQKQHTVTVTCADCSEPVQETTTEDCIDENSDNTCDRCEAALPVAVSSVTLDQTALTLDVGSTATLVATVAPENATDKTYTWSSADESIATVDANGVVTGVGAGTVAITATTTDGGKTGTCTVTVNAVQQEDTGIANGNIVDVADNLYYNYKDQGRYTATAENITISDAVKVVYASESGTEVYVKLDKGTDLSASFTATFGVSVGHKFVKYSQDTTECTLTNGYAVMEVTLTGSRGSDSGTATYTIYFSVDGVEPSAPVRVQESLTLDNTEDVATTLNLGDYFTGAKDYYLVENGTLTKLDGKVYAMANAAPGEFIYVFAAGWDNAICQDHLTVTVNVAHVCSFDAQNTDEKYLVSAATCTTVAKYYYSCGYCGATGTETFEYGSAGHNFVDDICTVCGISTAPEQDADGYYKITNAGELIWFAALVNGKLVDEAQNVSASAILMADIELTREWIPIGYGGGNNSYAGTFEGQGHTVSGLNAGSSAGSYRGLFGYLKGATIKNLTVEGSIGGTKTSNCGGIAGYTRNSTIQNCISRVNIGGSASYAGGITAGMEGSAISGCGYEGTISTTEDTSAFSNYAGGIVGIMYDGSMTDCYSTGSISSVQGAGGIVGYLSGGSVSNCYNLGSVANNNTGEKNTDSFAGGIAGRVGTNETSITNVYTVGTISSNGAIGNIAAGTVTTVTNSYYLSGVLNVEESQGTAKTSEEMKAAAFVAALGENFQQGCGSYPVLAWQTVNHSYGEDGVCTVCGATDAGHICTFNQKVAEDTYLAHAVDCETPATYYYSCSCGEAGTETFTVGEAWGHDYVDGFCSVCDKVDPGIANGNVIDITDNRLLDAISIYLDAIDITISDNVTVISAEENGTTIDVVLAADTYAFETVKATFGYLTNSATCTQDVDTHTLDFGNSTMVVTLNAVFSHITGTETYTINFTLAEYEGNTAPTLADGVDTTGSATITSGETYTLDVSPLFADADNDELTYYVSFDGKAYSKVENATYSYTGIDAGIHTLVFKAYDGKSVTGDTYTVTLTVENTSGTYSVPVSVPANVDITFYAASIAEDGTVAVSDELTYTNGILAVPENVSRVAWTADGYYCMSTGVTANETLTIALVTFDVNTWDGTDDDNAEVVITDQENYSITGTAADKYLLAESQNCTYAVSPSDADNYNPVTMADVTPATGVVSVVLPYQGFTITVPAGSTLNVGKMWSYYTYNFKIESYEKTTNADGTVTYAFRMIDKYNPDGSLGGSTFLRVQHPDGVTYWDYRTFENHDEVIITAEDIFLNSDSFKKNTILHNFEELPTDVADIYLSVNKQMYVDLDIGETYKVNVFRNWQAIEGMMNNKTALPDVHYTVIDANGNPSDVITVTPDAFNSSAATVTANSAGTAIVLVTYDAMYSTAVCDDAMGYSGKAAKLSAIWPENTGVFVVSVGADGSAIVTNMDTDPEHDPIYFVGTAGAEFSFTPESSCTVSVARAVVGTNSLTYNGFSTDNIETDAETGEVTIKGLTQGRHIIKVEKNGVATYQVVTTKQTSYTITDAEGNTITENTAVAPGTELTIQFSTLYNPVNKLAGVYNSNCAVLYTGEDGTAFEGSNGGTGFGFYVFAAASDLHKLTVKVPSNWTEDTYTLEGSFKIGGFGGGGGGHRGILLYETGKNVNNEAEGASGNPGVLPEITIEVDVDNTIPVTSVTVIPTTAEVETGKTVTLTATVLPEDATAKTVTWSSSDETVATVDQNGVVTGIKAGEVTVIAEAGGKTAQCKVTVTKAPDVAVTGITLSKTSAELKVGKSVTLQATVSPDNATDKTVTWTSSDESVATVIDGTITANAEGNATITASAGSVNATCTITVVKDKDADGKATVYFSVSHDAEFIKTESGTVAALQKLDVPYFDLSLYGLDEYKLAETDEGYGKPTMLHLYIYATEIFQCGVKAEDAGQGYLYNNNLIGTDLFTVSGSAGSIFMEKFWNMSMNLNYYHNYSYPADADGWGITADRVVLSDGDIVTIGHFTSWGFYTDSSSVFNYVVIGEDTVVTSALETGEITLNVYRAGADMGNGGANTPVEAVRDIYYVKADALTSGDVTSWTKLGTTDAAGQLKVELSALAAGQYILAVAGQKGVENPNDIVSTPGGIILNVLADEAGKQVQDVINLIDTIGEVTLDSEAAITAARNAYDALAEDQKAAVTNYTKLTDAEAKLAQLKQEKADQDAADAVTAKINAIDTVTLDSKTAIEEARAAYDALTDAQKALVSEETLKKLTDAEAEYAKLIADEADKATAKAVEEKITTIGTVTLDSEQKIIAARQAYDALTDTQKQLVGNYDVLTAAEKKLAELKDEAAANAVEEKIAAIGTVTLDSEDKINAARVAYDALTDTQKALVENLSVLEAAEEALELLKLAGTDITDIYQTTGDYLTGLSAPGIGSTNGEWRVIGLVRAGREVPDSFYEAAVKYVQDNIDESGRLHAAKSTDNSRMIVALTAIGNDVTDVGGYDLLSGLDDMDYIGNQGINGTIWALIAFDSHDYEIPTGDVTREKLVQAILDAQLSGGGWALAGTVGDPDMTGMALQALAPYYGSNAAVTTAVDKALTWLSGIQAKDGTFTCSEGVTSESLSQVITALTALGINPETDSRFVKNGVSAVDALSKFYVEGGGFKHGLTGERNMMATEQGYYALVSYYRLLQGKTSLYDMSDVTIQTAAKDQEAADAVEALIDAIGMVTKDSGDKIKAARDAYNALTDAQKALVENYKTLTDAEAKYAELVKTAEDEVATKAVEDKIDAIGTVTLSSENKIKEARNAYEALTDIQKALVSNLDKLESAEKALAGLKDEAAADAVEKLIDAIGTVTLDSEDKITAARNAYDALTEAQKKLVENYKTLTDAESKLNELKSTVSVTFTLLGCSKHGSDKVHTLAGGNLSTWIAKKTYKVAPGATVKDVLDKALAEAGMACSNPTGNYVESINGIGEFTNGSNSGWMYTLNGTHPNLGVAEQTVKNGDVIVFHYTDDYTKEEGSQGFGDRDEEAAEAVEKLIDAIGTVTLNSKSKIDAARKAYDALTYTQKQLVDNYKKMTDAEAKYAQLKAADDEKKAEAVEDLIDAIMPGSTTFEEDVKAAQKAYNNLTADQKKLVDNYYKLVNYQKELADEEDKEAAKAVEDLIDAIGTVTKDSEDEIKAAREAYEKLTDEQKKLVGNLAVLEAAEERLAELKALAGVEDIYKTTGDYLENLGMPGVGSVGGEWMVIGLIRSGREIEDVEAWYDLAVKYVQENIDENERLHQAKSTENARLILALTAIGKDVTNVGGHDLLKGLNSMEYIQKQGINGPIWALLAFDSGNYPVPDGDISRAALIQVILDAQLADGGWALTGTTSDPDITGMALQALAPYYQTDAKVKEAINDAIDTLSEMQAADGSYASIDGTSSESISQVIVALAALGIDADKDARFIKNGTSALDALCTFYVQGGGFKHIPTGKLDGMATEQAYYALTAYFRMLDGKTALYNMTDVIDLGGDPAEEEPTETLPTETEPAPTEPVPTDEGKGGFPWWLVIVIVVLAGAIVVLVIVSKPKKHKYVR